jgi:hypothetical protein
MTCTREKSMYYKSSRTNQTTYDRNCARQAEKLSLIGATRAEVAKFFGVEILTLEEWARQHKDFGWALQTDPTAFGVTSEDYGLYNWLKDYRRGFLDI